VNVIVEHELLYPTAEQFSLKSNTFLPDNDDIGFGNYAPQPCIAGQAAKVPILQRRQKLHISNPHNITNCNVLFRSLAALAKDGLLTIRYCVTSYWFSDQKQPVPIPQQMRENPF